MRDLLPGDSLRSRDGQNRAVISASPEAGSASVFNLEVEGDHTYFVGARQTLVHNGCGESAVEVTTEGLATVSAHLERLEALDEPANAAMLERLQSGERTAHDINFTPMSYTNLN